MNGKQIIHKYTKGRLASRPECYSGRGATLTDLDSNILQMIYTGVHLEFGEEAAKNFVQLVYEIDYLAATAFLNIFYQFVANGCQFNPASIPQSGNEAKGIDLGREPEHQFVAGFTTLASVMSGSLNRDESPVIRGKFLDDHDSEYERRPEVEKRRENKIYRGDSFAMRTDSDSE